MNCLAQSNVCSGYSSTLLSPYLGLPQTKGTRINQCPLSCSIAGSLSCLAFTLARGSQQYSKSNPFELFQCFNGYNYYSQVEHDLVLCTEIF